MFTGIIEEVGRVARAGSRLTVECRRVVEDAFEGSSLAVNGVCLTAVSITPGSFSADLAPETLRRTNLGALKPGSRVNLERPVQPSARLSGHIVQGHVDATAELISLEPLGDGNWWLTVQAPPEFDKYLVYKGSIAIDGISLTIAAVKDAEISVTIIPHTYNETSLGERRPGDRLNIECDILAKHVEKLLASAEFPGRR